MAVVEVAAQARNQSLRALLEQKLQGTQPPDENTPCAIAGVMPEFMTAAQALLPASRIPAAVLVPIVDHAAGLTALFTQRATHLRTHAGQISFPGGRIEADEGPLAAALRETEEEIGLPRERVSVLGYLQPHMIFTGYCVAPVVGLVRPGFELQLDANEVAGVFEVPLLHLLDPVNHQARQRQVGELSFTVHDIAYDQHRIWGATAGIVMSLYRLLTDPHP